MDMESVIRPYRKALVLAAEGAIRAARERVYKLPDKTQFNRLVSICGEASCAEEIRNYLLYQTGRNNAPWERKFAELVIERANQSIEELAQHTSDKDRDQANVAAWRLYAVFLARAVTYWIAVDKSNRKPGGKRHDRPRR